MSVKINGEEFKIYLQDTLDTIKERYCRNNDTIPVKDNYTKEAKNATKKLKKKIKVMKQ
jgi:hypothetical protein